MADFNELRKASERLGDAALNPAEWGNVLEGLCRAVQTSGAILVQPNALAGDVPRTASVEEMFVRFDRGSWHTRDIRAVKAMPRCLAGESVVVEQDILTPEEIRRSPIHHELIFPSGFCWWAVASFRVGPALWGLALHRTSKEGPFDGDMKRALTQLGTSLSEAATLSRLIGHAALTSSTGVLNHIGKPALAISDLGFVLDVNDAAGRLFGPDIWIAKRRLRVADRHASAKLEHLIEELRAVRDDRALRSTLIVVRRTVGSPILIRVLPVTPAARSPFLGARALLTLLDLGEKQMTDPSVMVGVFGLTAAEARLAVLIGAGQPIELAAETLAISPLTARTQLKAIFAKTDTHRQGELVALLSRLHVSRTL